MFFNFSNELLTSLDRFAIGTKIDFTLWLKASYRFRMAFGWRVSPTKCFRLWVIWPRLVLCGRFLTSAILANGSFLSMFQYVFEFHLLYPSGADECFGCVSFLLGMGAFKSRKVWISLDPKNFQAKAKQGPGAPKIHGLLTSRPQRASNSLNHGWVQQGEKKTLELSQYQNSLGFRCFFFFVLVSFDHGHAPLHLRQAKVPWLDHWKHAEVWCRNAFKVDGGSSHMDPDFACWSVVTTKYDPIND